MARKLIIDGNAVYEIDEECMLKKRVDNNDNSIDDNRKRSEKDRYRGEKRTDQADAERENSRKIK